MKRGKFLAWLALAVLALAVSVAPGEATNWIDVADTGWYDNASPGATQFDIWDANDLAGLAKLVSDGNDFANKTVTLKANINLAGREWTPIWYKTSIPGPVTGFAATFNGGGYTISNMTITGDIQVAGLFGVIDHTGSVKNLNLTGVNVNIDVSSFFSYVGSVAVINFGTVSGCTINGSISSSCSYASGSHECIAGGVVGVNSGTVSGCTSNSSVSSSATGTSSSDAVSFSAGGVVGSNGMAGIVTNCEATGRVSAEYTDYGVAYVGGVIGYCGDISGTFYGVVSGNAFSTAGTGQQWGVGLDIRLNPPGPSNNGTAPDGVVGNDNYPIIFIPGIMGSHLFTSVNQFTDATFVWPPVLGKNLSTFAEALKIGKTVYIRPYDIDQHGLAAWSDGGQEVSGVSQREYGAQNTYREIINALCDNFPGRPVYFFSYDWRQNNAGTALKLRRFIEELTVANGKVDLVCHSMGGLVASSYYKQFENDHRTNKIVTAGTPYEGSHFVFPAVIKGDISKKWHENEVMNLKGFSKEIKKQFWSIPQVTPTEQYHAITPTWYGNNYAAYSQYQSICAALFGEDNARYGKLFQDSICTSGYNTLRGHPNAYFVVGKNQRTIGSLKFSASGEVDELIYANNGDGTVHYQSASMMRTINMGRLYEYATDHAGLVGHPDEELDASAQQAAGDSMRKIVEILQGDTSRIVDAIPSPLGYTTVRAACPVDATISKDGEVLTSKESEFDDLASFGRMDIIGENGEIKMFCVDDDVFPVTLEGTDSGTMDYSIAFYGADNNLIEERFIEDVPITDDTVITTDTDRGVATVLDIDIDGDGTVDERRTLNTQTPPQTPNTPSTPGGSGGGGGCDAGTGLAGLFVLVLGFAVIRRNKTGR
ncbi:MAG: hypothetical protein LBS35_13875 [Synergistaceae bacterium]|jgi:pimeloyl-ACP methyl ester carboxylesterase|nr:hypothetical protein [Synergistaceae bacterium]